MPLRVSAVARTGKQASFIKKFEILRKGAEVLLQSTRRIGSTHPLNKFFLKTVEEATEAAAIATAVAMSGATDTAILHVASQAEKAIISAMAAQNAAYREIRGNVEKPLQAQVKAERKIPPPRPVLLTPSPVFEPRVLVRARPQRKTAQPDETRWSAEQNACSMHSLGRQSVSMASSFVQQGALMVRSSAEQNASTMRSLGKQNIRGTSSFFDRLPTRSNLHESMHSLRMRNTPTVCSLTQQNVCPPPQWSKWIERFPVQRNTGPTNSMVKRNECFAQSTKVLPSMTIGTHLVVTSKEKSKRRKDDGSVAANVIAAIEKALGDGSQKESNKSPNFSIGGSNSSDDTSNAQSSKRTMGKSSNSSFQEQLSRQGPVTRSMSKGINIHEGRW